MKLTIEELKSVIRKVARNLVEKKAKDDKKKDEKGKKGVDGYVDEDVSPRGFSSGGNLDFSQPLSTSTKEGNRLQRQGKSNMGPWTSESALRAIVKHTMMEEFKLKPMPNAKMKESAPYNTRVHMGKQGSMSNPKMEGWKTTKKEGAVWEQLAHWYSVPVRESKNFKPREPKYVKSMETQSHSKRLIENTSRRKKK